MFWGPPDGPCVAGLGVADSVSVRGVERFRAVEEAAARLWAALRAPRIEAPVSPLSLFGGFAFAPGAADDPEWRQFGDGQFLLPRWTYAAQNDRASLSLALRGPETPADVNRLLSRVPDIVGALATDPALRPAARFEHDPTPALADDGWAALVAAARGAIREGRFEKVVLSRRRRARADRSFDPARILGQWRVSHPEACRFAFRPAGGPTFLGGTPELLVIKRGLEVASEALAGTAARTESDAAALGRRLLASPKDRLEHSLVVDGVRDALSPLCAALDVSEPPEVRALPTVLHLSTSIRGRLRSPTSLATLVAALHPTPATGGRPRAPALDWLAAHEPAPRGWYAAPIGRLGADGDGEFGVAIRSALLRGAEAFIFAGAGIVADSDPRGELAEIAAKERTILAALEG